MLCILFIVAVFITDFKQKTSISHALWLPIIWLLFCGSRSISYWLNPVSSQATEVDYLSGTPIDRSFLVIIMVLGLIILFRRKIEWAEIGKYNFWLVVFYLYIGISVLWADYHFVSFKRWIKTIGDIIMVLIVLSDSNPQEAIKKLFRRCAFVLLPFSVLFIKYYRNIGVAYSYDGSEMWVGITTHKNHLGQLCFILGFFLIWEIMSRWERKKLFSDKIEECIDFALLAMALWMLYGSKSSASKTSILVFVIGICLVLLLRKTRGNVENLGKYFVVIVCSVLSLYLILDLFLDQSPLEYIVAATGRDMTLTGRTDLWKVLIDIGSQHPILGAGYGSFWIGNVHNLWYIFQWRPESAHNGYIDIYVQLGYIGLVLLIGLILSSFRNIKKKLLIDFDYGLLSLAYFVMILVYNIAESAIAKPTSLIWYTFLVAAVYVPKNYKREGAWKYRVVQDAS